MATVMFGKATHHYEIIEIGNKNWRIMEVLGLEKLDQLPECIWDDGDGSAMCGLGNIIDSHYLVCADISWITSISLML